jgi:16S rRNA (uracil1498-N3)-methyltransferase
MFYVNTIEENIPWLVLPEEESVHCIRVLRKKNGDLIEILNGKGSLFTAEIIDAHPKKCKVSIRNTTFEQPTTPIHIAVAPTKNMDRMEWLVEKGTELGCTHFSFIITKRCERSKVNMERLEKIAVAAMKQSKRLYLPTLEGPLPLTEFLAKYPSGWIAHCDNTTPRSVFDGTELSRMLIGPEGDFTAEEISQALAANYKPVTLGAARLRTETAALKSIIMLGDSAAHA